MSENTVFVVFDNDSCGCEGMCRLVGVYDDEDAAVAACTSDSHNIGILPLNVPDYGIPGKVLPGWYPCQETKEAGLERTAGLS